MFFCHSGRSVAKTRNPGEFECALDTVSPKNLYKTYLKCYFAIDYMLLLVEAWHRAGGGLIDDA